MKFNSQICTTREQSERLLELGLKKETADMVLLKEMVYDEENHCTRDGENYLIRPIDYLEGEEHRGHIPAWSLHRLIEMALRHVLICGISFTFIEDAYEKVIGIIEHQIKEGYFNKEYLQEQSDSRREG